MHKRKKLSVIGRVHEVDIIGHAQSVPVKIDTGADSSSIWASHIAVDKKGMLSFTLFDTRSTYYTGEKIMRKDFTVAQVKSSTGHAQVRYRTHFSVMLNGRRIRVLFNLSDRSNNNYPILIGRRTLVGKFIVDVRKGGSREEYIKTKSLNEELRRNPHAFFNKYSGTMQGSGE